MVFSKNKKLNEVLTSIYNSLLSIRDTEEESRNEIKRYMKSYPRELDYNIFQHGNLLVCPEDIRALFKNYSSLKRLSDFKIEEIYKEQIGCVCRNYF